MTSKNSLSRACRTLIEILAIIAVFSLLLNIPWGDFGATDFLQYWAGSRLFMRGENPYDAALILAEEQQVWQGKADVLPVLLWNPPLVFAPVFAFSMLKFSYAVLLWSLASACLVLSSIVLCWRLYPITGESCTLFFWSRMVFLFTFYPIALSLYYGQIPPLLLFGLSAYLYHAFSHTKSSAATFSGGLFLSLTLIKPHLLYLIYLAILLNSFQTRNCKTLIGLFTGAVFLALLPVVFSPSIFHFYYSAMQTPPFYWKNPNLGSWLEEFFGANQHIPLLRFGPTILLAGCFVLRSVLSRNPLKADVVYPLIPLSLLTSPYGWTYDQMLVIPTVFWLFHADAAGKLSSLTERRLIACTLITANVVMMFTARDLGQQWDVWYPAIIAAVAFFVWKKQNYSENPNAAPNTFASYPNGR